MGISIESLLSGGYTITTTMDAHQQELLEAFYKDAALFPPDDNDGTKTESAAVVIDPKTGGVNAIVGGRERSGKLVYNRAVKMLRQPGSTIKPVLVYAPAIENGIAYRYTILKDEPTEFGNYSPTNFDSRYYGEVSLRFAIAKSLNIPAVSLLYELGSRGWNFESSHPDQKQRLIFFGISDFFFF